MLYSLYITLCVYSVLTLVWGYNGIFEMSKLENFRDNIEKNIGNLEVLHGDLSDELERLKSSSELIRLRSRELGYFEKDEVIIKIADYRKLTNFYSVGRLIKHTYLEKNRKQLFRTISICTGIAGCIFLFLFQGFFRDSKKK